jgi:hypothetical protein
MLDKFAKMNRIIAFAILLLAVHAGAKPDSQPQPVKGTHIVVTAPPGFVAADRFAGFMSEETGASIMVSELPAPFGEVTKGFTAEGFKKQGMTHLGQEKASFGNYTGLLLSAAQSAGDVDFLKWLAVFGDDKTTYLVTATFPKEARADLSEVMKKAVLDARVSIAAVDPFDALSFRVSPVDDMKIAKVMGKSILLSKGGVFPAKNTEIPIFVVAPSTSTGLAIADKKAFAEARLQQVATLKEVRVKTTEPITVAGFNGFESTAAAFHTASGVKMLVYQTVLFDAEGYYLFQGIATESEGKSHLPTFKQITRSFRMLAAPASPK